MEASKQSAALDAAADAIAQGWRLSNPYLALPESCYTRIAPIAVKAPQLVCYNEALAAELGLSINEDERAALFAGNVLPHGAQTVALAYAGHQFGHFAMLGDGRAHLLGCQSALNGELVDLQLKGSGVTPYGRRGDGRAALGPMLREYLISEAMYALGVSTSRSLAVVTTGEPVMRQDMLQGAIVARTASSHVRVGTFELLAHQRDTESLRVLADFAIARHDPALSDAPEPYLAFFSAVMDRQIALVCDWLRVGFIHGVMNTDNMTISGETIDYGPCAFMDNYDPQTVFSSIDRHGRYAYANQPQIAGWNLARLAEAMLPLFADDIEQAAEKAENVLDGYNDRFQTAWLGMMREKLGLVDAREGDAELIGDLLKWMQREQADFTETFRDLNDAPLPEEWCARWQARSPDIALMQAANPAIIPRNHRVEEALSAAEQGDVGPFNRLLMMLKKPYDASKLARKHLTPPSEGTAHYQTFCGT